MQAKTLTLLMMTILFILTGSFTLQAGERIDGNGTIVTQQKTVAQFYKIEIETFCNVVVNSGAMPMVSLKVDENLQDVYQIKVIDGVLKISSDKWPEPSTILLTIQVPFITEFINSGWGKIKINNLNTENFTLRATTGNVTLKGDVEHLVIRAGTGNINSTRLRANSIDILQSGHGKTQLGESNFLTISGELGKIYYQGSPEINREAADQSVFLKGPETKTKTESKKELDYVTVTIKNNSFGWNGFTIRGPKRRPFSYGFSMFPYSVKKERVPIGTKFFSNGLFGNEKLLVNITAEDEGRTVNLFK